MQSSTPSLSTTNGSLPVEIVPGDRIFLSGCQSTSMIVQGRFGQPPAGWAPSTSPVTQIYTALIYCKRIAWENNEASDAHLLLEGHTNARPPDRCNPGAPEHFLIFSHLLSDNQALLNWFAAKGVNITHASFSRLDNMNLSTWSWHITNSRTISSIQVFQRNSSVEQQQALDRFAVVSGKGVTIFNYTNTRAISGMGSVASKGTFYAPMLYYQQTGLHDAVGLGELDFGTFGQIQAMTYGDLSCQS